MGIQTDFHPVVEEGKERSKGQSSDKDGDEAILDNQLKVLKEQAVLAQRNEIVVSLPPGVHVSFTFLLVLQPVDEALHIAV